MVVGMIITDESDTIFEREVSQIMYTAINILLRFPVAFDLQFSSSLIDDYLIYIKLVYKLVEISRLQNNFVHVVGSNEGTIIVATVSEPEANE